MSVRYRRLMFRLAYLLAGAALLAAASEDAAVFITGLIAFMAVSFRLVRLAVWFEVLLFRYARCSSCGILFDLCDRWCCRCGYAVPTYRHVFRGCANCRRDFPHVSCPRCRASVEVG